VDFSYTHEGISTEVTRIFNSRSVFDRQFIRNIKVSPQEPINIKVRIEDDYGNMTEAVNTEQIFLMEEEKFPKNKMKLLQSGDFMGGIEMKNLDGYDGRASFVIDDITNETLAFNTCNAGGLTGVVNVPWNLIVDLGEYYELSRLITNQYRGGTIDLTTPGSYFQGENVGIYNIYIWDDDSQSWEYIRQHTIPVPDASITGYERVKLANAGDEAYMYPDEPKYTKRTRWFRYEAVKGFQSNYSQNTMVNWLSEITFYGRKAK
jgi:hypothetical protein